MERIAEFERVSRQQFEKDFLDAFEEKSVEEARLAWERIRLPRRATVGSAGYDYYSPIDFTLQPGESVKIPTGVRVKMQEGWVLCNFPRSSQGFKYRLQLNNTVGIIDSDYWFSDNEGHILAKLTNDSNEGKTLNVKAQESFMQGIFLPFGITVDDKTDGIRNGGFGSTGR